MSRSEREKSGVTGTGMEEDKIFDEYRRAAGRIHVDDDMKQRVLGKVELRFSGTETVAYGELIKKRKSVQDAIGVQDEADGQDRIDEQDINDVLHRKDVILKEAVLDTKKVRVFISHPVAAMAACAAIFVLIVSGTKLLRWHRPFGDDIYLTSALSDMNSSEGEIKTGNSLVDSSRESGEDEGSTPDNTDVDFSNSSEYSSGANSAIAGDNGSVVVKGSMAGNSNEIVGADIPLLTKEDKYRQYTGSKDNEHEGHGGAKESSDETYADEPSLEPMTHDAAEPIGQGEPVNHHENDHVQHPTDALDTENHKHTMSDINETSGINETEKDDNMAGEARSIDAAPGEDLPELTIPESAAIDDKDKENWSLAPIHQGDKSSDETMPSETAQDDIHGDSHPPASPTDIPKTPWECLGPTVEPENVDYGKVTEHGSLEELSSAVHHPVYAIGWLPFEPDKVIYRSITYWSEIQYKWLGHTVILAQTMRQPPEDVLSSYNYGTAQVDGCMVWLHHDDNGFTRACWSKDGYWFFLYTTREQSMEGIQQMIASVAR